MRNKRLTTIPAKQLQWWGLVGAGACAAIPLYVANPAQVGFFPPCPIYALTGLYCAGCGTTRAVHQLLHGHWRAALRLNPLLVLLLPLLAYSFLSFTLEVFGSRRLPAPLRTWLSTGLLIGVVLAFTVWRNVPAQHPVAPSPH
ncbi:MAG: DUF2752 domain-containing protein [Chloroflexota bacterium]|nr:DUF2752 domain-containing protein [Chloroflexota bacterium]